MKEFLMKFQFSESSSFQVVNCDTRIVNRMISKKAFFFFFLVFQVRGWTLRDLYMQDNRNSHVLKTIRTCEVIGIHTCKGDKRLCLDLKDDSPTFQVNGQCGFSFIFGSVVNGGGLDPTATRAVAYKNK